MCDYDKIEQIDTEGNVDAFSVSDDLVDLRGNSRVIGYNGVANTCVRVFRVQPDLRGLRVSYVATDWDDINLSRANR